MNEWRQFFNEHAKDYMKNEFTANTLAEVDFLVDALGLKEGSRLLDIGCGTGRHSVEFAKRGCLVMGVDISEGMLEQAGKAADVAGVSPTFVRADASESLPKEDFDAAICLCEGAFCLLGADDDPLEHDLAILSNIRLALRPGGKLVLNALCAYRKIRRAGQGLEGDGEFDPDTMTETFREVETAGGTIATNVRERGYVPTEMRLLMRLAGMEALHVWGGTAGNWGERPVELDEYELMVVARKPE